MFDLDAYLARIGLSGRPSIAAVHRAHSIAIPFENLDPHLGIPVSLDIEDIERKLVADRRGGYCFEQNLLLATALEALGARVEKMLARVRYGAPAGVVRPRSHVVLRVSAEGRVWHADAGFGMGTLFEPVPFGAGPAVEQSGWRFRIVEDGPDLVLQTFDRDDWVDLYALRAEPVPPVDIETVNWFVCTHPRSPFVSGLVVAGQREDGMRIALTDRDGLALTERTPAHSTVTPLLPAEVPALLAERFGLAGFALAPDGRLMLGTQA